MQKPAETRFPVHELIAERWSPVCFDERPIEPEKIGSLFEAARWAPSSYNEQPWSFLAAGRDNRPEFDRLLGCLMEANQAWAKHAGLLAISVAAKVYARNDKPNRHAWHDVGAATQNLILQAMAMGLHAHPMGGFDAARVQQEYHLPEHYEACTAVAVGYLSTDLDRFSADLKQRQLGGRMRKPLSEMVFRGAWGRPFSLPTDGAAR